MQDDNENWVDGRLLWEQLGVAKQYTDWIKQQIEDMDLEEGYDYILTFHFKGIRKNVKEHIYNIKVSTAKEIAMVAGAKGGW